MCDNDTECGAGMACVESLCRLGSDTVGPGYRQTVPVGGWVLTKAASPHVFYFDVYVPTGRTLTIEAGARVEMAIGRSILVDGTLLATGAELDPITITAHEGGRWGAVALNAPSFASTFDFVELSEGSLSVRGGLSAVRHVRFTNAWVGAAAMPSFALSDCTFLTTDQSLGYAAASAFDVDTITIAGNSFIDVPGTAVQVRNLARELSTLTMRANRITNALSAGLTIQADKPMVLNIDGNAIDSVGSYGIYVDTIGSASLTIIARGNHVTDGGYWGMLVSADGPLNAVIDELPAGLATAVTPEERGNDFSDNSEHGLRVLARRGGSISLRRVVADRIVGDAVSMDVSGAAATVNVADVRAADMTGAGLNTSFRDAPVSAIISDVSIHGNGATGEGLRAIAHGGGAVSIARAEVLDTMGYGINVSMGQDGSATLADVAVSEVDGDAIRIFGYKRLTSVSLTDIAVSNGAGGGITVTGWGGVTLSVGAPGDAAVSGASITNIQGDGIAVASRGLLTADVREVTVGSTNGYGIMLSSRGNVDAAIYDAEIDRTTASSIYSMGWGLNAIRIGSDRSGSPGPVVVTQPWGWGVYLEAHDAVAAMISNVSISDGNNGGIGLTQDIEQGSGVTAWIDTNRIGPVRTTGISISAEAPIGGGGTPAVQITGNRIWDAAEAGIAVTGRNAVQDVSVRDNVVGDGQPLLSGGVDDTADCDLAAAYRIGSRGIAVTSTRARAAAELSGNLVCNVAGDGLVISGPERRALGSGELFADTLLSSNDVRNGNGTGILLGTYSATLTGNTVVGSRAGLVFSTDNAESVNLRVTGDSYLRNVGEGMNLGAGSWGLLTTVRASENGSYGMVVAGNTYAEVSGCQFAANRGAGIWSNGSYDNAAWQYITDSCIGGNGTHGLYQAHDMYLPQSLGAKQPPAVARSCIFGNQLRGLSGIAPDEAVPHWYATEVLSSNVIDNAEYGIVRAGRIEDSYVNESHFDDAADVTVAAGTCIAQGVERNATANSYTVDDTDAAGRNIFDVICISNPATAPIDFAGPPYDWATTAAVVGCAPDAGSAYSTYGAPVQCP